VDAVPQAVGEVEVQRGRREEQQSPPTTREAQKRAEGEQPYTCTNANPSHHTRVAETIRT
jgi:hypothetical protein